MEEATIDVGGFERPPLEITDGEGRVIRVEAVDLPSEELVEMYLAFDVRDRAQGLPPTTETAIRGWLSDVADGHHVVARHDGAVVGHCLLVEDPGYGAHELAIFVLQGYRRAGTGTRLVEAALGLGYDGGVRDVTLSVERWNRPAVRLNRSAGFREVGEPGLELRMAARLTGD